MPKAVWEGVVLAESDDTVIVEGNHYFPVESLAKEHFKASDARTTCYWKGVASYYDIEVDGKINRNAAWYYPEPAQAAVDIKDRVAFWRGVQLKP